MLEMINQLVQWFYWLLKKIGDFFKTFNSSAPESEYFESVIKKIPEAIERLKTHEEKLVQKYLIYGFLPQEKTDYLTHQMFFNVILETYFAQFQVVNGELVDYGGGNGWMIELEEFYDDHPDIKAHHESWNQSSKKEPNPSMKH
jgi:hypothetical protein